MIQTARRQVFPRVVGKNSALGFKLAYEITIQRGLNGRYKRVRTGS